MFLSPNLLKVRGFLCLMGIVSNNTKKSLPLHHQLISSTTLKFKKRLSIVGIAPTSSQEEFFNTIVHEAKHVQSHICNYYNVSEDGEQAAYLIGYIVQKMHKIFKYMISTGVK